jgi:hypothetical protein
MAFGKSIPKGAAFDLRLKRRRTKGVGEMPKIDME